MNHSWVFVTGGSRGIGAAIVRKLSSLGYPVAFTYRQSDKLASQLVNFVTQNGGIAKSFRCDGSQADEVDELVQRFVQDYGPPCALVNNQGIVRDSSIVHMSVDDWASVINSNLNSAFYFIRSFVPHLLSDGGCLIQLSSVTGIRGSIGQCNYAATKAGLIGLTKSLALELARFQIRVNAVCPGYIDTDMIKIEGHPSQSLIRQIPLRRLGQSDEVADLVAYLISPKARYITGQTIAIDGGLTC